MSKPITSGTTEAVRESRRAARRRKKINRMIRGDERLKKADCKFGGGKLWIKAKREMI